jgi:hypothetical protein
VTFLEIAEIKSVRSLVPVHDAQLFTCVKIGGTLLGRLLKFNEKTRCQGIRRRS